MKTPLLRTFFFLAVLVPLLSTSEAPVIAQHPVLPDIPRVDSILESEPAIRPTVRANTRQTQNMEAVGRLGGDTYAVAAQGSYVYIGAGPRLIVLDASSPNNPMVVGQTTVLQDIVQGLAVAGNYVYVADGSAGLRVIDVSNPGVPQEVGAYDTPGYASKVFVSGAYAYVAAQDNAGQYYASGDKLFSTVYLPLVLSNH